MKIIHAADLHLDSPFAFLGDPLKKKQRKAELLKAFDDMVSYGAENGVSAIIIAGDLFDKGKVSADTRNTVVSVIEQHPQIAFFYLRGNHDRSDLFGPGDSLPANLYTFGTMWTYYNLGSRITLCGAELGRENALSATSDLVLDSSRFNIVVLHGQTAATGSADGAELINVNAFRNKGIDYMALGHVHSFKLDRIDSRGTYCYPGCLEARGFDETGAHGFVLLDIDETGRTCRAQLISTPIRTCRTVDVDISGTMTTAEALDVINAKLEELHIPERDLVELRLTGNVDVAGECDEVFAESRLQGRFYYLKVRKCVEIKVDYEAYELEQSLKGEFVRTVRACEDLSDEDKAAIIKMGIDALRKGEVE